MKFLKYFLICVCFISCVKKKYKNEESKYQILNLIYNDLSKNQMEFFVFPKRPFNPNFKSNNGIHSDSLRNNLTEKINTKDSLKKINYFLSKKENQQIFAFDLKMEKYHSLKNREMEKNQDGFKRLYKKFVNTDKIDSLNINKILPKNNDSIIKFRKELLKENVGVEFRKFNVLISFSDIVFNKEKSKAIIIGTRSFSRTNSHSLIYFLEKQNGKWKIMFEQIP